MQLCVQGAKVANNKTNFLAGKDPKILFALPVLWTLSSNPLSQDSCTRWCWVAGPCLAAGLWTRSNHRGWKRKGKCPAGNFWWTDATKGSCSSMRGAMKSWPECFWEMKSPMCSFKEQRPLQKYPSDHREIFWNICLDYCSHREAGPKAPVSGGEDDTNPVFCLCPPLFLWKTSKASKSRRRRAQRWIGSCYISLPTPLPQNVG